jgi:hypothetical protein
MEATAVLKKLFFSFFIFLDPTELASVCYTLFLSLSLKITGPYCVSYRVPGLKGREGGRRRWRVSDRIGGNSA